MAVDWEEVLTRLSAYPTGVHNIMPAVSNERLAAVEAKFGTVPSQLRTMLATFNGAELFVGALPLITFFGVSSKPPLSPMEWAPDWYVDVFTSIWRNAGTAREHDWPIAMMNDGTLIVMNEVGHVKLWDSESQQWGPQDLSFLEWFWTLLNEGDSYWDELN